MGVRFLSALLERGRFKAGLALAFCLCFAASSSKAEFNLDQMARLAQQWDSLHQALLPAPQPRETATRFGTLIDASCFTGLTTLQREQTLLQLETVLARAIEGSQRCFETLRIVELPDVITVLRRTRIRCRRFNHASQLADMEMYYEYGPPLGPPGAPPKNIVPRRHRSAATDFDFQMTLSLENMNQMSIESSAAVLAHEAMHVLAMNNRSWHNSMESRHKRGCADSQFTDRIYLTQAACFPQSTIGQIFFGPQGAADCPEVCIEGLTGVDSEVAAELAPTQNFASTTGVYGAPLVARPYPREEADRICARIRETKGSR